MLAQLCLTYLQSRSKYEVNEFKHKRFWDVIMFGIDDIWMKCMVIHLYLGFFYYVIEQKYRVVYIFWLISLHIIKNRALFAAFYVRERERETFQTNFFAVLVKLLAIHNKPMRFTFQLIILFPVYHSFFFMRYLRTLKQLYL